MPQQTMRQRLNEITEKLLPPDYFVAERIASQAEHQIATMAAPPPVNDKVDPFVTGHISEEWISATIERETTATLWDKRRNVLLTLMRDAREVVEHPPFPHSNLQIPTPAPLLEESPAEPQFVAPPPPTGLSKVFGGKQKHAEATAQAHAAWKQQHRQWADYVHGVLLQKNARLLDEHAKAERLRADKLASAVAAYQSECSARERDAAEANARVDAFQSALASGDPEAIDQYVGVVLGNSVYPDAFDVSHDYSFDPEFGELTVRVFVPPPADLPTIKLYRYVAASDEIRETPCAQKEQRERYNRAVAAVAVRTFHEVFESDREERIKTISLTVEADAISPATGLVETYRFVAAAADRDEFSRFNLANVDPAETLAHMRSSVSKNAFGLRPISTARGVR